MNEPLDTPREISLLAVWAFLVRHKAIIVPGVLLGAIAAGALAFAITPRYRAEVVFSPVDSTGSLSSQLGASLGGIAALAGLNLGGTGKRAEESIEYLRSREFTREFIQRHALMPILFANKWDAARNRWRTDEPPTIGEGVDRLNKKITQVTEDHRTGIVTLAVIWRDRRAAAEWANALVADADAALRQKAIAEYARSIDYLKQEGAQSTVVEVRAAVYKTMESELKDAMLARTRDAYAFRILDPAVVRDPKDTDSPNKRLFVAMGASLGLLFGIIVGALRRRPSAARPA